MWRYEKYNSIGTEPVTSRKTHKKNRLIAIDYPKSCLNCFAIC